MGELACRRPPAQARLAFIRFQKTVFGIARSGRPPGAGGAPHRTAAPPRPAAHSSRQSPPPPSSSRGRSTRLLAAAAEAVLLLPQAGEDRLGAHHQQAAQVAVAGLGDPSQAGCPRAYCPRREGDPGRHLAPVLEVVAAADAGPGGRWRCWGRSPADPSSRRLRASPSRAASRMIRSYSAIRTSRL